VIDTCPLQGTIVANSFSFIFCILKVLLQWEFIYFEKYYNFGGEHAQCLVSIYLYKISYISFFLKALSVEKIFGCNFVLPLA